MKEEKLIAMLGGGQLGLMFTEKAQEMGQKVLILDPDTDCPAGKIADKFINASFDDSNALNFILKNSLKFPEFLTIHVPFTPPSRRGKYYTIILPRPVFHKLQLDI